MVYYIWKSYKFNYDVSFLFDRISKQRYPFFLDSSLNSNSLGRYSFLGFDPFRIININGKDSFNQIRFLLGKYRISLQNSSIPFLGGAVGYLSYDLGFDLEKKLSKRRIKSNQLNIPDSFWGIYSTLIIIDHLKLKLHLISLGIPEKNYELSKLWARDNFKKVEGILSGISFRKKNKNLYKLNPNLLPQSNFTRQEYTKSVRKAKDYIRKGDIYQVNLSQQFQAVSYLSAPEIYQRLRRLSPACFSAYFDCGDFQIISSSPEEFLRLNSNYVLTRPMKGTRRRSHNKTIDKKLKRQLLNSLKDAAELIMIVDLERNDLGKVCDYHSIKVNPLKYLEEYKTVFQTTATIKGLLHKDKDRVDLIKACFPGGSITGCPKLRAMEIIEELEPVRRNIYTGALGYLSFSGGMNLNILIRTILKKGKRVYFGVGSGIVADSDPGSEYKETLVKAMAMIKAIG